MGIRVMHVLYCHQRKRETEMATNHCQVDMTGGCIGMEMRAMVKTRLNEQLPNAVGGREG